MFGRAEDQFDMFTYLALYIVTTTAAQQKVTNISMLLSYGAV